MTVTVDSEVIGRAADAPSATTPDARRRLIRQRVQTWIGLVVVALAVWELAAALNLFGSGTLPTPWAVVQQLWADRSLYPQNVLTTLLEALPGLGVATVSAVVLGVLFCELPLFEGLLSAPTIGLLCAPYIALAPILYVAFSSYTEKFALAGMSAFFPVLVATVAGMRMSDPKMLEVVHAAGGNRLTAIWKVKLPSAAPSIASGIQIAAPAAVLGAILGEFAGGESGLGVFMMNSLAQFDSARTWGAGGVATLLGAAGYLLIGGARRRVFHGEPIALSTGSFVVSSKGRSRLSKVVLPIASIGIVIGAWWLGIKVLNLQPYFVKSPADVWDFFFTSAGDGARSTLFTALWQTLPGALIGAAVGMAIAFGAAAIFVRSRLMEATVMPVALILQAVPLQAMAPLIVVVLGRGLISSITVAVLVTLFPAVVLITFGLRDVPKTALDVFHTYDASELTIMAKLRSPAAMPKIFAAARMTAPGALMGVLVAEYLASGQGIGYLIVNSNQDSQYDTVWAAAVLITLVSVMLYLSVARVERWALARYSEAV